MRRLSEARAELSRSWMRGGAASAARARKSATSARNLATRSAHALRGYGATPHPTPAKLTAFAKPSYPSPARGEGQLTHRRQVQGLSARFGLGVVDLDGEAAVLDGLFLLGHLGDDVGRDLAFEGS